jgi:uncharacterized lipoprotein YddW (UPF0748 family)
LGWYVSLNPCLPEVRSYLVSVFEEIVANYPIDGLHLDYIRFPSEESPKGSDYPYDRRTMDLFARVSRGKKPWQAKDLWSRWRCDQITQLVRGIHRMVKDTRPQALLTAACGPNPDEHRRRYFQDGPAWLRYDLIDAAFVMNYTRDTNLFRKRQEAWRRVAPGKTVAVGIGMYLHKDDKITINQLQFARYWGSGFSLFSASSIFEDTPRSRARLKAIRPILQAMQRQTVAMIR